jgi:hypothetical protein
MYLIFKKKGLFICKYLLIWLKTILKWFEILLHSIFMFKIYIFTKNGHQWWKFRWNIFRPVNVLWPNLSFGPFSFRPKTTLLNLPYFFWKINKVLSRPPNFCSNRSFRYKHYSVFSNLSTIWKLFGYFDLRDIARQHSWIILKVRQKCFR